MPSRRRFPEEHVARIGDRKKQRGPAGAVAQLLSQPRDEDVDGSRARLVAAAVQELYEVLAAQRAPWSLRERGEQPELEGRELQRLLVQVGGARVAIDAQRSD